MLKYNVEEMSTESIEQEIKEIKASISNMYYGTDIKKTEALLKNRENELIKRKKEEN